MACSVVKEENNEEASQDEDEEAKEGDGKGPDYDYLLGMTMWSLTKERKDELLRKRDEKQTELRILQGKSAKDIWMEDLNNLLEKVSTVTSSVFTYLLVCVQSSLRTNSTRAVYSFLNSWKSRNIFGLYTFKKMPRSGQR